MRILKLKFQSTLPIREETIKLGWLKKWSKFQSTLPIREETCTVAMFMLFYKDFNPLFPYGKRLKRIAFMRTLMRFQSTLPIREETFHYTSIILDRLFQSTLPIREETGKFGRSRQQFHISIHSSHTGRDSNGVSVSHTIWDFNPLFPYGKRPRCSATALAMATYFNPLFPYGKRRCDFGGCFWPLMHFNPLFPYGKRLAVPQMFDAVV